LCGKIPIIRTTHINHITPINHITRIIITPESI
jgi:hypothetical protein